MTDDTPEPIIDPLLEELLGGQHPPDLKQRILAAHAKRANGEEGFHVAKEKENARTALHSNQPTILPSSVAPSKLDAITTAPQVTPVPRTVTSRRRTDWRGTVIVAAILISACIVAVWALSNHDGSIVTHVGPEDVAAEASPKEDSSIRPGPPPAVDPTDGEDGTALLAETDIPPGLRDPGPVPTDDTTPDISREYPPSSPDILLASTEEEIVEFIDERLESRWTDEGIDTARSVDDAAWCGRVYRRLLGRPPTFAEVGRFRNDRDRQKRSNLVATLFAREGTISEFANHWAGLLATVLVGDKPPSNVDRAELERYLRSSLFVDKPYDQLVSELITAVGSNKPGQDDFNGATNFLLAFHDKKKTAATDQVCRVFLGRRMQCAQCHDHPLNEWRQEQYWQLTSFFMQMQAFPLKNNGGMQLVNRDYPGESGTPKDAELFYEEPGRRTRVAYPRYLDGTPASSDSGLIEDANRRQELASMVVKSDEMSKALVNRVWDQMFGFGFTHPVDDMGPHNLPSHPQLLKRLAREFKAHDHSIQDLVRWLVLSKAFDRPTAKDLLAGYAGRFSSFQDELTVPNRGLGNLLRLLAEARRDGRPFEIIGQFQENGNDAVRDEFAGARIEGKRLFRLLDDSPGRLLPLIANSKLSDEEMIGHLFMATVARLPNRRELADAQSILTNSSRLQALRDIGATLVLSREFADEH